MDNLPDDWWPDEAIRHSYTDRYRVPLVSSLYPRWKYLVAVCFNPNPGQYDPWGGTLPTEAEAAMIGSYIDMRREWFNARWKAILLARPVDVDSGSNTTILIRYGPDAWGYRQATWDRGPTTVPGLRDEPETLLQVLDRREVFLGTRWADWQASHADVFAKRG